MAIPSNVQAAITRLTSGYNNGDYNASSNPLGFSAGGHRVNLYALTADMTLVGNWYVSTTDPVLAISSDITSLAAIAANITTLAGNTANINTLAGLSGALTTLGNIAANITTVAGVSVQVTTVAGLSAQITALGAIASAISTVATNIANVNIAAGVSGNITTVAGIASAVSAVSAIATAISAVAGNATNINTVSAAIAAVNTCAANIAAITSAATNASAAAGSASAAATSAAAAKRTALFMTFDPATADADPGNGKFRFNNASLPSVTQGFFDLQDATGGDITAWVASWDDSTNLGNRGTLTLVSAANNGIWAKFRITGGNVAAAGYRKVALDYIGHAGTLAAGDFSITFEAAGDKGLDGAGAGDILGPAGGVVDGEIVVFNSTTGKAVKSSGGRLVSDFATAAQGTKADSALQAAAIGVSIQAHHANLLAMAGLSLVADQIAYADGTGTLALTGFTAAARTLLAATDAMAQRQALGLIIGTNVQAYDAELAALATLISAPDQLPYFTGSGTASLTTLTGQARTFLAQGDVSAQQTALGVSGFIKSLLDDADATTARATLQALGLVGGTLTGQLTVNAKVKHRGMATMDVTSMADDTMLALTSASHGISPNTNICFIFTAGGHYNGFVSFYPALNAAPAHTDLGAGGPTQFLGNIASVASVTDGYLGIGVQGSDNSIRIVNRTGATQFVGLLMFMN